MPDQVSLLFDKSNRQLTSQDLTEYKVSNALYHFVMTFYTKSTFFAFFFLMTSSKVFYDDSLAYKGHQSLPFQWMFL